MSDSRSDTIVAQATPPGRGGIGIIRISGSNACKIATAITGTLPEPRQCANRKFRDTAEKIIDLGLVVFFPGPNSFTGEDVIELHGHGGPVIIDMLLQTIISHGARLAKPGEFSERAFLNDKIDLTQAEAIADLIDSHSQQAAQCAVRSLQGEFSTQIHDLVEKLIAARMYVEAAIDFPEEEIDFLSDSHIGDDIAAILEQLEKISQIAEQGSLLRDGITIVLAGKPNAGKSSILNQLSGQESAIVTDIPGTTRDVLRERILLDGIPVHVVDTAGLRDSDDIVEQEGVKRAWAQIKTADRILIIVDSDETDETDPEKLWPDFNKDFMSEKNITIIRNKIDKTKLQPSCFMEGEHTIIQLSAKSGQGFDLLREHLKQSVGADTQQEGLFIARRRHLDALNHANRILLSGLIQFKASNAGELLAEDLREAQRHLNEITGEFTSDDLLGKIFSSFCIGK